VKYDYGPEQVAAFDTLKRLLCTPGIGLHRLDPDRPLKLITDWSVRGISAILIQRDDNQQPKLLASISRTLNQHEQRYEAWEGELLALQ